MQNTNIQLLVQELGLTPAQLEENHQRERSHLAAVIMMMVEQETKKASKKAARLKDNPVPPIVNPSSTQSSDQSGKSSGTDSNGFPIDPNGPSTPAQFDQIIQEIENGTLKGAKLLHAIQELVQYCKEFKDDNSLMKLTEVMIALGNKWDTFSKTTQDSLTKIMSAFSGMKNGSESITMFIARLIRNIEFFENGANQQQMEQKLQELLNKMEGAKKNPFISDLIKSLNVVKSNLSQFYAVNWIDGKPSLDPYTASMAMNGDGYGKYLIYGTYDFWSKTDYHSYYKTYIDTLVDQITKKYKNGSEVIMLLSTLLFGQMDDMQMQLAAYGDTNSTLSKMSDLMNEIQKIFQKDMQKIASGNGNFPADDIKKMMSDIHKVINTLTLQSGRFGSLGKNIRDQLSALLDYGTDKKGFNSFDDIFNQWMNSSGDEKTKLLHQLQAILNAIAPSANSGNTTYNAVMNGMGGSASALTSRSNLTGQLMTQLQGQLQQILASTKKMLDSQITWSNSIVQNTQNTR
jgi:hypothetical protein